MELDKEELEATRRLNRVCRSCERILTTQKLITNTRKRSCDIVRKDNGTECLYTIRDLRLNYCPECGRNLDEIYKSE